MDPYSQYDDDSSTHYYFLPAIPEKDMCRFKQAFREMNKSRSINVTLNTNNQPSCKFKPPIPPRISKTEGSNDNGDYCVIKTDTKPVFQNQKHCLLSSASTRIKKENLQEFASRFQRYSCEDSNSNKTDSQVEFEFESNNTCTKTKTNSNNVDRYIDYCTCMICIKSASYNFTGDDTDEYVEPCSCTGSTKSVIGRYLCMGLITIFLPCMLCYLPAKVCKNSVCKKEKVLNTNNNKLS